MAFSALEICISSSYFGHMCGWKGKPPQLSVCRCLQKSQVNCIGSISLVSDGILINFTNSSLFSASPSFTENHLFSAETLDNKDQTGTIQHDGASFSIDFGCRFWMPIPLVGIL
jgi:hypothetical protein